MATAPRQRAIREIDYPTGDGKPMAETDLHRDNMIDVIQMLRDHFAKYKDVYVSGNLLDQPSILTPAALIASNWAGLTESGRGLPEMCSRR